MIFCNIRTKDDELQRNDVNVLLANRFFCCCVINTQFYKLKRVVRVRRTSTLMSIEGIILWCLMSKKLGACKTHSPLNTVWDKLLLLVVKYQLICVRTWRYQNIFQNIDFHAGSNVAKKVISSKPNPSVAERCFKSTMP